MFNVVPIKNSKKPVEPEETDDYSKTLKNMDELKEAFKVIEEKPDKVNPHNVVKMFRELGYGGSSQGLIDMFEYLTSVADKEGFVNYQQFLEGCQKFLGQNGPDDYLKRVFEMYADKKDKNNVSKKINKCKKNYYFMFYSKL
jgi:Ca2+-binding EF-hand superfamily protein